MAQHRHGKVPMKHDINLPKPYRAALLGRSLSRLACSAAKYRVYARNHLSHPRLRARLRRHNFSHGQKRAAVRALAVWIFAATGDVGIGMGLLRKIASRMGQLGRSLLLG